MMQKTLMALAIAGSLLATGCGGGGSSGGSGSGGGPGPTPERNTVSGPLDAVQTPVSAMVIAPLADAVSGTPLEGVLACVDQVVVGDVLDALDALALSVDPGSIANPAFVAASVQGEVTDLVADLQGLIFSLAGSSGCNLNAAPQPGNGSNPLAGTPLASLGALLPQLTTFQGLLDANTLSLGQLNTLVSQLSGAFNLALPGGVGLPGGIDAPIVGPALETISQSIATFQTALAAAASGNPTAVAAAITASVEGILGNVLTGLVPLDLIENTSGDPGAVTGQIQGLITQFTGVLGGAGGLGSLNSLALEGLLGGELGIPNLLDPFSLVLAPVLGGIGGLNPGSGVGGPTGTPLDGILVSLTGLLGTAGTNPLTSLLGPLLGGVGGGGSCPLAGTPLSGLCGILGG
ncbi:MAG: hypothetical protein ACT4PZ_00205 [Panacagrimonas sp.]